jgi:plastocyanin
MFRVILAAAAAALTALVIVTAGLGGSTPATLQATVGPGYTIGLTQAGKTVKTLKPGTYRIAVADRSGEHNFVLARKGAAPRQLTTVGFTGTKTVTVQLAKGTWTYFCAPHASVMVGGFGVGATAASANAAAAAAPAPSASNGSSSGGADDSGDDD